MVDPLERIVKTSYGCLSDFCGAVSKSLFKSSQARDREEEKSTPCSLALSRFSQLVYFSACSGTNLLLRAKQPSVICLSLSVFLVFSNMSKSHFLVETERDHVCVLYVNECVGACVDVYVRL